jgi:uncharacterized membrane protein/plastocyanin
MHGKRALGFFWLSPLIALSILFTSSASAQEQSKCDAGACYIEITKNGFVPNDLTINAGSTVVWKNVDDKIHAVNVYSLNGNLLVNSTLLRKGESFQFTFGGDALGMHRYIDASSSNIEGRVEVEMHPNGPPTSIRVDFENPNAGIKSIFLSKCTVTKVSILPGQHRLDIGTNATESDNLRIKLDRRLFDSKSASGIDVPFQVVADNELIDYKEVFSTPVERVVSIPVLSGTKVIGMIGSHASTQILGYHEANLALNEATKTINSYRARGIVVSEADSLLLQAKQAFAAGKYPFAKDLANEATSVANGASRSALAASKAMDEASASINATKTFGIGVSDAEAILLHTKERYAYGGYDDALNTAVQARIAASSRGEQFMLLGVIGGSSVVAIYLYITRHRPTAVEPLPDQKAPPQENVQAPAEPAKESSLHVDLERIFVEKPHLREDDRQVLQYVYNKGGKALLANIRNDFGLPKSTAWRLVKRLEREELVDIVKFGNQNLVICSRQPNNDANNLE